MRVFALLMIGVLSGCASSSSEPAAEWHGDVRFTLAERAEIERGVSWMHEQAGLAPPTFDWKFVVSDRSDEPKTIRRERGYYPGNETRGAGGLCRGGAVYLDPIGLPDEHMKLEYLAGLAAHEFAHCELGFVDGYHPQDTQTDGIMRVLDPMRWTSAEQLQCREHADRCPSGRLVLVIESEDR